MRFLTLICILFSLSSFSVSSFADVQDRPGYTNDQGPDGTEVGTSDCPHCLASCSASAEGFTRDDQSCQSLSDRAKLLAKGAKGSTTPSATDKSTK